MPDDAVERLLREIVDSRVGPLSVTVEAQAEDSWRISTAWYDAVRAEIEATFEEQARVLRLERSLPTTAPRELWRPVILAKPWVMDAAPVGGGDLVVRLWLHVSDLDLNTLLAALADLTRLSELLPIPPASVAPVAQPSPPIEPADSEPASHDRGAATVEAPTVISDTAPAAPVAEAAPARAHQPAARHLPWEILSESPPAAAPTPQPPPIDEPAGSVAEPQVAMPPPPMPPSEPPQPDAAPPPEVAPEPEASGRPGYCKECGSAYAADHVFCTNCGARLN